MGQAIEQWLVGWLGDPTALGSKSWLEISVWLAGLIGAIVAIVSLRRQSLALATRALSATRCIIAALLVCLLAPATSARAEKPTGYEPQAEVYTEHGQTIGCGLSFIVAWVGDGKHQIAVSGSANFFLTIGGDKRFVSMLKIGGLYDLVKTPLAYAWIDTAAYGKTSGFSAYAGDETEKSMFLAGKNGDAKGFALPLSMATAGFTLGVSFGQQTIDNVVDVPAADPSVVAKVRDCSQALAARVKAMSGQ